MPPVLNITSVHVWWPSHLPFPTPGNLPDSEIKLTSLVSPELAGGFFTTAPPGKPMLLMVTAQTHASYGTKYEP